MQDGANSHILTPRALRAARQSLQMARDLAQRAMADRLTLDMQLGNLLPHVKGRQPRADR